MTFKTTEDRDQYWKKYANDRLVGRKIVAVRWLGAEEVEAMGWYVGAIVLHLDDGSLLFPSSDDEGNDAGALFGQGPPKGKKNGEEWTFPVMTGGER